MFHELKLDDSGDYEKFKIPHQAKMTLPKALCYRANIRDGVPLISGIAHTYEFLRYMTLFICYFLFVCCFGKL